MKSDHAGQGGSRRSASGMSYKFQRLRERIRQAVAEGELAGKLPGERELARRFQVNAKTLSKALTDLAAEGLLQRSIGRGTFVRSSIGEKSESQGAWLLLVDRDSDDELVKQLLAINPRSELCPDVSSVRPSVLNQFCAVVDLAASTPETFFRDLLVRGIPMVTVAHEPRTYSVNRVLLDSMLGAAQLTRQFVLGGHRHFLAVEQRARITIADTIRQTAARYCDDFCVDACPDADVAQAAEYGPTACICDSAKSASRVLETLGRAGISVPENLSVAAVGWRGDEYPCSGYFAHPRQQALAISEILTSAKGGHPVSLWLAGMLVDRHTIAPIRAAVPPQADITAEIHSSQIRTLPLIDR